MQEYETNFDNPSINIHLLVVVGIAFLVIGVMFYPMLKSNTSDKDLKKEDVTTNVSNAIQIQYEYITVMVTPTPDGVKYFASEYESGIRKIGRPFSWIRPDVTGLKDLVVHARVYDYREFLYYTWFNPTDYKYYKQYPTSKDNKFLFVFVNIYMDDISGEDTRLYLPKPELYGLEINGNMYYPIPFAKQLRIKELEETWNYNEDSRIKYYATNTYYTHDSNYAQTAGETYEELTYLKGGKSNAIDGYIVFEIPKDSKPEDMIVRTNFYAFGSAAWRLKLSGEELVS